MKNTPKTKLWTLGLAAVCFISTAQAATYSAAFSQSNTDARNDISAGEFLSIDGGANTNPIWSFWSDETGTGAADRYLRFRMDVRSGQFRLNAAGGSGFETYVPLSNDGSANTILTNDSHGWSSTLSGAVFPEVDFGTGAGVPLNGFTSGGVINWVMMQPDGTSTFAPDQSGQRAVAFGFTWDDANTNNIIDAGDTIKGLYAVTADTFSEMDTVGELNAIAIPESGNFALIGGFLALVSTMVRRRRS